MSGQKPCTILVNKDRWMGYLLLVVSFTGFWEIKEIRRSWCVYEDIIFKLGSDHGSAAAWQNWTPLGGCGTWLGEEGGGSLRWNRI